MDIRVGQRSGDERVFIHLLGIRRELTKRINRRLIRSQIAIIAYGSLTTRHTVTGAKLKVVYCVLLGEKLLLGDAPCYCTRREATPTVVLTKARRTITSYGKRKHISVGIVIIGAAHKRHQRPFAAATTDRGRFLTIVELIDIIKHKPFLGHVAPHKIIPLHRHTRHHVQMVVFLKGLIIREIVIPSIGKRTVI